MTEQFDETLDDGDLTVIQSIRQYRLEADDAKRDRISRNRRNRDVYLGRQDWTHKQEGQSSEFLPKLSVSAEQMASFIKRGLVQFGDWYSVQPDNELEQLIKGQQIAAILNAFTGNLWAGNNKSQAIATVLSDTVKNGLMDSLMILKVHGGMAKNRVYKSERGDIELTGDNEAQRGPSSMSIEDVDEWRLRIDLIRSEDYYPDPTGNGLYEIHRVERDLHEVIKMAEDGIYDKEMVDRLVSIDYPRPLDEKRTDRDRAQPESTNPSFRKRVVLDEFWGTLLNSDGTVAHQNVVATVANDKYLIRPPEPNPFWHQESPFVVAPLIRVPFSVWHKALYDEASALNLAINEMFNLILDGGMAAVWGIKQLRVDDLEDPGQVSGGIPQGSTLAVKSSLPHNGKVLEQVTEGDVPSDAMAVFEFLNREFTQAALSSELKMGSLPAKQVKAAEVVEVSQNQAITLDGIVSDLEADFIPQMLRKAWLTILQNADSFPPEVMLGQIDKKAAMAILRASPSERFMLFAGRARFRVFGLSATMAKAREFQKVMALIQSVNINPLLLQAFMRRFSADKTIDYMMRLLQINPDDIQKTGEELDDLAQQEEKLRTMGAAAMAGGQQSIGGPGTGGEGAPAEVNQMLNPLTGMTPG